MTIQPGELPLSVKRGATLKEGLTWTDADGNPISLVGYSALMMIRANKTDATPLMTLSSVAGQDGTITLGGAAGTIALTLPAAKTALIPLNKVVYDLRLTNASAEVFFVLEGEITLEGPVTR